MSGIVHESGKISDPSRGTKEEQALSCPAPTLPAMFEWMQDHPGVVWSFVVASIVVFLGSALVMPALAVRIPADYFAHHRRPPGRWADQHPAIRLVIHIVKNVLGGLFMLAGAAMLFLPGQGLLTLLIGFLILDFPGKYGFDKWLIRRRPVHRSINWLRRQRGREPLRVPTRDPRSNVS